MQAIIKDERLRMIKANLVYSIFKYYLYLVIATKLTQEVKENGRKMQILVRRNIK